MYKQLLSSYRYWQRYSIGGLYWVNGYNDLIRDVALILGSYKI